MIDMYDIKHVKKVRVLDSRNCPIKSEKNKVLIFCLDLSLSVRSFTSTSCA